jgi:hypothetical protein
MSNNTWSFVDYYDVLGNAEDGWDVNGVSVEFDDLYLDPDITDEEIVEYLKNIGYFTEDVQLSDLEIWDDGNMIEFSKADDGMPLCRLQRNY